MRETFNIYELVDALRSRWTLMAIACVVAAVLSVTVTLLQAKQYTAAARILIEPPAGSESRASMVVSPQYLESLKSYEHLVSGDNLFRKALDRFGLRTGAPGRSIESWKGRVLKVALVRNTKVLEIAVTLEDPTKAQAMARFLAEEAIQMSATMNRDADNEPIREAEAQLGRAKEESEKVEAQWSRLVQAEPLESIESEVRALETLRSRIDRTLLNIEVDSTAQGTAARVQALKSQRKTVEESLARNSALIGQRTARREQVESQRRNALALYDAAWKQYEAARAMAGRGGERLRLMDPGIVPEQPSSPSLRLNVLAALLFALTASAGYIIISFGYRLSRSRATEPRYLPSRAGDD